MLSTRGAMLGFFVLTSMAGGIRSAFAWTDDNPAAASQCSAVDVNDAGTLVENCKVADASTAYMVLSGSTAQLSPLSSTPGGVPCSATAINNAQAGHETIIGRCNDGNNVSQAVAWSSSAPSSPLQLMPVSGLLGIGAGVRTRAVDVSAQGTVIGSSFDASGSSVPVYWNPGSGTANALPIPLLAQQMNCAPTSINNTASPSIVGNCPAANGKSAAVLWNSVSSAYATLPVPSGASYCDADQVNAKGQILGNCRYGTDTYRAVVWGAGGTGPSVLMTVNGNSAQRSIGAHLNDTGMVAVDYLAQGAQAGFYEPALWNPAGSDASAITLPSGAIHGTVLGLGNNGKMIGNFETSGGDTHPFHVEPNSLAAVDDGSPEGGPNAAVTAYSPGGTMEAGQGENSNDAQQAIVQAIP